MQKHAELRYEELIAPDRFVTKILMPNEIPVHPLVYNSDFAYTAEFIDKVEKSVVDSLKQDILTIDNTLGTRLRIAADNGKIRDLMNRSELILSSIEIFVNSEQRFVEVSYTSSNIALDTREGFKRRLNIYTPLSLSPDKLKEYSLHSEETEIASWHIHNLNMGGFALAMYFRNFAIMFNNLGLRRLDSS